MDKRFVWLLLAVSVAAVFFELGRMDVVWDNEGQRAAPPLEMLQRGDFVVPTINGADYLVKPPLLYWAIAASYRITGVVSPLTARIPGALCAVALVMAVYAATRREIGETAARWASLMLLASPYFLERAHWAQLDVPFTCALFIGLWTLRSAFNVRQPVRTMLFMGASGLALGAAFMLKGPPALLLIWAVWIAASLEQTKRGNRGHRRLAVWTAAALGVESLCVLVKMAAQPAFLDFPYGLCLFLVSWSVICLRNGREGALRRAGILSGALLVGLAISAPWCLALLHAKGWANLQAMLHEQVLTRTHTASQINSGSPFYYLLRLPALLAPWGLLLPLHLSKQQWRAQGPAYRFCLVAGWGTVAVFSLIAGKENEYIMPAFAFLLIVTGHHMGHFSEEHMGKRLAAYAKCWRAILWRVFPAAAAGITVHALVTNPNPTLVIELATLAILATVAAVSVRYGMFSPGMALFIGALLVMLQGITVRSFHFTRENSPRRVGELAGQLKREGFEVEVTRPYPPIAFYARTDLPLNMDFASVREKLGGEEPYYYLTQEKFTRGLSAGENGALDDVLIAGPSGSRSYVLVGNTRPDLLIPRPPRTLR